MEVCAVSHRRDRTDKATLLTMPYVVRGKIGAVRGNEGRVGHLTYLAEAGDHFYIWDGAHKAAHFRSAQAGLDAAGQCNGPWFNMPDPTSVESLEWAADMGVDLAS
jgi:hypothetical protein